MAPSAIRERLGMGLKRREAPPAPAVDVQRRDGRERDHLIMPFHSNIDQRNAIRAALTTRSLSSTALLAGKTQTILNLIALLIAQGKTVMSSRVPTPRWITNNDD